ncbi:hypothetical protein ACFVXG_36070 [Kitasatospora sp. NPDC058162]|uniref:hypothetical protein n=1 Tax=Kitasatospora sp. NPDC058162 TaxID=3346362 RepID=UPI0036DB1B24
MSAVCPGCAAGEHALPVPEALEGGSAAGVDASEAVHLAPPPEPRPEPEPVREGAAPAVLVVLAALWLLLGVLNLLHPRPDLDRYDDFYRAGYLLGGFVGPALLTAAALVVRTVGRRRARRRQEERLRAQQERRLHLVQRWRRGWWCRRCRVAFFPAGALHPACPPSPALAAGHYPAWVLGAPLQDPGGQGPGGQGPGVRGGGVQEAGGQALS